MKTTIQFQYFPQNKKISKHLQDIVDVFEDKYCLICSPANKLESNDVLDIVSEGLTNLGFDIEKGKKRDEKIQVPVLFGKNGVMEKSFDVDGYNENEKIVIEIEAGRAVTNYQFLKDLFQACVMSDVEYLVIAVRNIYLNNKDFEKVITFFNTLYASGRLVLPLKGILIIGY
jgi:hypothetical protein